MFVVVRHVHVHQFGTGFEDRAHLRHVAGTHSLCQPLDGGAIHVRLEQRARGSYRFGTVPGGGLKPNRPFRERSLAVKVKENKVAGVLPKLSVAMIHVFLP